MPARPDPAPAGPDPFPVLADPVRRLILERLAQGEAAAGDLVSAAQDRYTLSQPAVSLHLRVLRDAGFVSSRVDGARRVYRLEAGPPWDAAEQWLARVRPRPVSVESALDALGTEIARGRRQRRRQGQPSPGDRQAG